MRRVIAVAAFTLLSLTLTGCGDGRTKTVVKVSKGGQVLAPEKDHKLRVVFVPILADGKPPTDYFYAPYESDKSAFVAAGKDKGGLPPGKYRLAVINELKGKDLYQGAFDEEKSPFIFDVDDKTKEIVIDLDNPPAKK